MYLQHIDSLPKLLLQQLVATRNSGLKHPRGIILFASSHDLVKAYRTPTAKDVLSNVGVIEVDEVDEVSLGLKERLLLVHDVLCSALDQSVVALVIGSRHVAEGAVRLADSETKQVGDVGNRLQLRQKLDKDSVHLGDVANALLPNLKELYIDINKGVVR